MVGVVDAALPDNTQYGQYLCPSAPQSYMSYYQISWGAAADFIEFACNSDPSLGASGALPSPYFHAGGTGGTRHKPVVTSTTQGWGRVRISYENRVLLGMRWAPVSTVTFPGDPQTDATYSTANSVLQVANWVS